MTESETKPPIETSIVGWTFLVVGGLNLLYSAIAFLFALIAAAEFWNPSNKTEGSSFLAALIFIPLLGWFGWWMLKAGRGIFRGSRRAWIHGLIICGIVLFLFLLAILVTSGEERTMVMLILTLPGGPLLATAFLMSQPQVKGWCVLPLPTDQKTRPPYSVNMARRSTTLGAAAFLGLTPLIVLLFVQAQAMLVTSRDRQLLKWIEEHGGQVKYNLHHRGEIESITIYRDGVDAEALSRIERLEELNLGGRDVFDGSWIPLLTQVEKINVEGTSIDDFEFVKGLQQVKQLSLADSRLSDLTPVSKLEQLEILNLSQTRVTSLTPLSKLKKLKALFINETEISDLSPLTRLTGLTSLSIDRIKTKSLAPIHSLKSLKELSVIGAADSVQVQRLRDSLPGCYIIESEDDPYFRDLE